MCVPTTVNDSCFLMCGTAFPLGRSHSSTSVWTLPTHLLLVRSREDVLPAGRLRRPSYTSPVLLPSFSLLCLFFSMLHWLCPCRDLDIPIAWVSQDLAYNKYLADTCWMRKWFDSYLSLLVFSSLSFKTIISLLRASCWPSESCSSFFRFLISLACIPSLLDISSS